MERPLTSLKKSYIWLLMERLNIVKLIYVTLHKHGHVDHNCNVLNIRNVEYFCHYYIFKSFICLYASRHVPTFGL